MDQPIRTHRLYVYRVKSKSKIQLKAEGKTVPLDYVAEKFVKIGMTSQSKIVERFTKFPDAFVENYTFTLLTSQKFETRGRLFDVEQELHASLKGLRYTPRHRFSGWTECYMGTVDSIKQIKAAIWAMREKHSPNCKALKQKTGFARMKAAQKAIPKGVSPARLRRKARRTEAGITRPKK